MQSVDRAVPEARCLALVEIAKSEGTSNPSHNSTSQSKANPILGDADRRPHTPLDSRRSALISTVRERHLELSVPKREPQRFCLLSSSQPRAESAPEMSSWSSPTVIDDVLAMNEYAVSGAGRRREA